jgi:hypothetical protein
VLSSKLEHKHNWQHKEGKNIMAIPENKISKNIIITFLFLIAA